MLDQRGDIDATILAVYIPVAFLSVFLIFRYGLKNGGSSWIYLTVFAAIRIIGAAMSLNVELSGKTSLAESAAIVNSIALSPLLMTTISLTIPRKNTTTHQTPHLYVKYALWADHVVVIIAVILAVTGGTSAYSSNVAKHSKGQDHLRASAGFFVLSWIVLVATWVICRSDKASREPARQNLFFVVEIVGLPALFVRILYTVLGDATVDTDHTQVFNAETGSWVPYLIMAFLPEVVISLSYVITAIVSSRTTKNHAKYQEDIETLDMSIL